MRLDRRRTYCLRAGFFLGDAAAVSCAVPRPRFVEVASEGVGAADGRPRLGVAAAAAVFKGDLVGRAEVVRFCGDVVVDARPRF